MPIETGTSAMPIVARTFATVFGVSVLKVATFMSFVTSITSAAATTPVTGWGLIDHRGAPSVALYPIAIGGQSFVLIVGGLPRLAQEAFVALVTALSRRYGAPADGPHLTRTSPPPH